MTVAWTRVTEFVSPGVRVNALVRPCLWYGAEGVQITLLVDPADLSVLAFSPNRQVRSCQGTDRIDVDEVIPGIDLTVAELFASRQRRQRVWS